MAHGPANGGVPIGIGSPNKLPYWSSAMVLAGGNTIFNGNGLNIYGPNPWADVVAFGADPTGASDSSTAIQNAINSLNPGGIVWVPAGTYKLGTVLTCTTTHIQIIGASKTDCVFNTSSASGNMLDFNSWYCGVQNITFNSSVTRTAGYAVRMLTGNNRHYVINCEFNNMFSGVLMQSHLSFIDNCEFRTFVAGGSWIELACTTSSAHDFQINHITGDNGSNLAGSSGILISQCASLLLTNCSLSHGGNNGAIFFNPGASQVIPSVYCVNVFFDQSGYGAQFTGNSTGTVQRCKFTNCWFSSSTNDGVNFNSPNAAGLQGIDFVNCDFYQNVNGINAVAGYQDWSAQSSRFSGNTTTGIKTAALSTGSFSVVNNFIGNGSGFGANALGINIQTGTYASYTITQNRGLNSNTTAGITDSGSVTGFRQKLVGDNDGGLFRGKLASIVATSGAINTTETVIVGGLNTCPIPANSVQIGDVFRIVMLGTCTSTAANASTFALRIGTAGTVSDGLLLSIATPVTAALSGTNTPFRAVIEFTVRTLGVAGTVIGNLTLLNHGTAADAAALGISTTTCQEVTLTPAAFNSTVNNYLEATYKSAAATTTSTFQEAYIEKL